MPSEMDRGARHDAVERALTAANVHRRRGDWEAAWRALDDALVMAPEHAPLLELMGQFNLEQGEYAAAAQCYRRALELEPGRPASELGFAKATLLLKEADAGGEDGPDPILAGRQPSDAMLRSTLVPGMGQAYAGDLNRGLAFLLPWLLLWTGLAWNLWGTLSNVKGSRFGPGGLLGEFGAGTWVLVASLVVLHLAAGIDAGRRLQRVAGDSADRPPLRGEDDDA